jgi:diguanylate cyclase (GGDEF)-like protein
MKGYLDISYKDSIKYLNRVLEKSLLLRNENKHNRLDVILKVGINIKNNAINLSRDSEKETKIDNFVFTKKMKDYYNSYVIGSDKEYNNGNGIYAEKSIDNHFNGYKKSWEITDKIPPLKLDFYAIYIGFIGFNEALKYDFEIKNRKEPSNKSKNILIKKVELNNKIKNIDELENSLSSKKYCISFIDIDKFSLINDKYGNDLANEVLKSVNEILCSTSIIHKIKFIHYESDEFIVLAENCSMEKMKIISNEMMRLTKSYDWKSIHPMLYVSISIGYVPAHKKEKNSFLITLERAIIGKNNSKQKGSGYISLGPTYIQIAGQNRSSYSNRGYKEFLKDNYSSFTDNYSSYLYWEGKQ